MALEEILLGVTRRNDLQQVRAWKLLLLLPRMLLHRPPRGGQISKDKLIARFDKFAAGQWQDLLRASAKCAEDAGKLSRRQRRRDQVDEEQRATRALKFVQLGELSAGRQALEGAEVAPGTAETLRALRNRPATARDDIPELPRDLTAFNLDEDLFNKNVRTARKGVAGGPSGMTHDHLRLLLESLKDLHLFFAVCDFWAKGQVPREAVNGIKLGRMTALRKENGGVRGIVAGEVVRRVQAKTIAQQLGPAVKAATAPNQYALSTRAGCECIAHALQAVTELDQEATVTTIDGISAYDSISRRAMLLGLDGVAGGRQALPFVRLEDASGTVHTVHQGEGGEQGDPPHAIALFCGATCSIGGHPEEVVLHREAFGFFG